MKSNKTPGNDELTKEFYKTFWDELKSRLIELKTPLMESVNRAFYTKILSISQKQAVLITVRRKTS